jgi:branched-chain amino acid transport system substrate-binding protein
MNAIAPATTALTASCRRRTALQMGAALVAGQFATPMLAQARKPAANEITIGQTAALTGPLAFSTLDFNRGVNAHLAEVNAKGGVGGRKIRLISLDDGYVAARAKANFTELVEAQNVFALLGIGGTPANMALGPLLAEARIPLVGPISGADILRTPANPFVFHTRASYGGEMVRLAEQMATIGQKRVAVVYSDNPVGKVAATDFGQLAKGRGLEVAPIMIGDGAADFPSAMHAWMESRPNAVMWLFASAGPNGIEALKQFRAKSPNTSLYTISLLAVPNSLAQLGPAATNMTVSQVVPFPYRTGTSPLIRNYQGAMKASKQEPFSHTSLEGYINAKVLVHGLRGAGSPPTRERFIATLESTIDLDGYTVDYKNGNRNGSGYTDLVIVDANGRFVK